MQHPIPLKRFEYCVADPGEAAATSSNTGNGSSAGINFHLTNFDADFEKGRLSLNDEQIRIKAAIRPGYAIDLSGLAENALIFSLDGVLEDGSTINTCSGLLVLQTPMESNARKGAEWRLSVYLYDDFNDDREIKLNLCMLPSSGNAQLN